MLWCCGQVLCHLGERITFCVVFSPVPTCLFACPNVWHDENSCLFLPPSLPTHFWSSPLMFWCLGGVRRSNSRRKFVFFLKECTLPISVVVVVSFCFFRKEGKEVVLSRMFLAGGREDVRVDVHMKRGVVKLFSPFFFLP